MHTTLNKIKSKYPCPEGWEKLLKNLHKNGSDDQPLYLDQILASNGIRDAVWALRCFEYRDYCLFNVEVVEIVIHMHDHSHFTKAIEAIRSWHNGDIDNQDLKDFSFAAYDACFDNVSYCFYAASSFLSHPDDVSYSVTNDDDDVKQVRWDKIQDLFIKHFCTKGVKVELQHG